MGKRARWQNERKMSMDYLREVSVSRLKEDFLTQYYGLLSLQEQLVHSPGCLLWKGPKRQYVFWQYYRHGRQIQKRVQDVEKAKEEIEALKHLYAMYREKKAILREYRRALKAFHVDPEQVLREDAADKELKRQNRKLWEEQREKAKTERYGENKKHFDDAGHLMRAKSELMIANELTSGGVEFEYEKALQLNDKSWVKPDFTIRRPDNVIIYWEHAGMLEDPVYRAKFEEKIARYKRNGIEENELLIVTREKNGVLDLDHVRRLIVAFQLA